jgi:hypothetical protein
MATLRPLPHPNVPAVDPATGRMTPDWYLYFQSRERMETNNLMDVAKTAPANGEVLIFNDMTGQYEPGAN